jgi:hypothetical protein
MKNPALNEVEGLARPDRFNGAWCEGKTCKCLSCDELAIHDEVENRNY